MSAPQTVTAPAPPREPGKLSAATQAIRAWDRRATGIVVGAYGVVAAAAALSFESLQGLAGLVGYSGHLTAGLPLTIDLYAAVDSLIWLGPGNRSEKIRKWAQWNTYFSAILSISCNALYHALLTGHGANVAKNAAKQIMKDGHGHIIVNSVNAGIVVAVAAIPPVILVLVVHLLSLLAKEKEKTAAVQTGTARPDTPIVVTGRPAAARPEQKPAAAVEAPAARPELPPTPVPAPTRTVVPIAEGTERRQRDDIRMKLALAEFARLEAAGVSLSQPGLNKQLEEKLGASERSILNWKKAYSQQKNGASEASG